MKCAFLLLLSYASFSSGGVQTWKQHGIKDLFKSCPNHTSIYQFNSCEEMPKRLASGAYQICKNGAGQTEIFSFLNCLPSGDQSSHYDIKFVTNFFEGDYLVRELRASLATAKLQKDQKASKEIETRIKEIRLKFPSHNEM